MTLPDGPDAAPDARTAKKRVQQHHRCQHRTHDKDSLVSNGCPQHLDPAGKRLGDGAIVGTEQEQCQALQHQKQAERRNEQCPRRRVPKRIEHQDLHDDAEQRNDQHRHGHGKPVSMARQQRDDIAPKHGVRSKGELRHLQNTEHQRQRYCEETIDTPCHHAVGDILNDFIHFAACALLPV